MRLQFGAHNSRTNRLVVVAYEIQARSQQRENFGRPPKAHGLRPQRGEIILSYLTTFPPILHPVLQMRSSADPNKSDAIREYVRRRPNSTALEVVRGVKREMGVDVSVGLAAKVKRQASATGASATSNGVTKAEQIRQAARSLGRKVRPRDVIAKLAEQGVSVSSAQVSAVLSASGMKRRRRSGRRAAAVEMVTSTLTLESLLAAKRLVNQLGSVAAAKTAVDALARLS
jgi:hypothetical protein